MSSHRHDDCGVIVAGSVQEGVPAPTVGFRTPGTSRTEPHLGVVMHAADGRLTAVTLGVGEAVPADGTVPQLAHTGLWAAGLNKLAPASGPLSATADNQ